MIALWTAWLDAAPLRIDLLDADERGRAERFRHALDRDRFVARRGLLRLLLGRELGRRPEEIVYTIGSHGKPAVAGSDLSFSTSHAHGLWLCAVARSIEIGCDVEWIDPALADMRVAERLFAPGEVRRLSMLAGDQWVAAFFECWTRKEAFVKALGLGLSYPLDAFEVSFGRHEPARLLAGGDGWGLHGVTPAPGYCAALAASVGAMDAVTAPRILQT